MADLVESNMTEPIKASSLLRLERGFRCQEVTGNDISVKGLDRRFAKLWSGSRVVGIGSESDDSTTTTSLPLHVLAAILLKSHSTPNTSSPVTQVPPAIFIIAPHTSQTIPLLHAHLANSLSNSQAAIELLESVRFMQFFDLAGLAESVAEVSERVYEGSQQLETHRENVTVKSGNIGTLVLIQGVASSVSAVHRRGGLVQANALLAGLIRNITQLSKSPGEALVLLEVPVEVDEANDGHLNQDGVRSKPARSLELDSSFFGPNAETLRLLCGHETLARTLDSGLDCLVVIHDAFGRIGGKWKRSPPQEQVVEVIKDRVGDLTGLWHVWKEA